MSEKNNSQNGKVCYLEIPAKDVFASATFYEGVFGWRIRKSDDGSVSFDDGVGQVSGMWVADKKPMAEPGIIISIMVDNAETSKELVLAHGGKILSSMNMDSGEVIVHFTDPAGNFMGIYQEGKNK